MAYVCVVPVFCIIRIAFEGYKPYKMIAYVLFGLLNCHFKLMYVKSGLVPVLLC